MSDFDKVIKGLETCIDREPGKYTCNECPYEIDGNSCELNLAKEALALLKEQEAKPIIRKQAKKEYEDGSTEYFAEWYCPRCNQLMNRGFDTPWIKYCYNCGKPIIWEGR